MKLPPSPVEEEVERAMDDPYVSTVEGVTVGETAYTEPPPAPTLTEHVLLGVSFCDTGRIRWTDSGYSETKPSLKG